MRFCNYTPAFITQYIVAVALGGYLERKEKALWQEIGIDQIRANAHVKRREAEIQFWERYRDEVLVKTRVIDPACGSGAFLIAAFDYLNNEYERVNEQLAALKTADDTGAFVGQRSLFDLTKTILNQNLYGVDLSPESVEITKLSLWLKTAERGKQLTYLDDNIKVGNSIVADPAVATRAFDWEAEFAEVFADGGFDVVIGNPPYVRQELLTPFKPYLQSHYATYDGVADLYVYFYEKGLKILRPNGVMSYIVTNKWLRAGYGEPLRKFFAENSVFEQIIDFGHAPIFQDADVFPCIVAVRKPNIEDAQTSGQIESQPSVQVCAIPREDLSNVNLPQYVNQEGHEVSWSRFSNEEWSLESPAVENLVEKIQRNGTPLVKFIGSKPVYGIKTGYNKAFLIDSSTKEKLVLEDKNSIEVVKPYLRGQDIKRWHPEWQDLWMIVAYHGIEIENYPAIRRHLDQHRLNLEPCPKDWNAKKDGQWQGRKYAKHKWYELQDNFSHWGEFSQTKIVWQDLAFHPRFCLDSEGLFAEMTCFALPCSDLWVLAILNSPIMWAWLWRNTVHGKDEVLRLKNIYTESIPIAPPTDDIRAEVEPAVQQLIEFTKANQQATREVLDWFRVEHGIDKAGNKLSDFAALSLDDFLQEVKKRRPRGAGNLGPKDIKTLSDAYGDYALPIQQRRRDGLVLEHRISDLVNQAYGLTPEEIDLMWKTAPPRMPFSRFSGRPGC